MPERVSLHAGVVYGTLDLSTGAAAAMVVRTLGAMKRITYAERAMLMGDAAANLLIEFGAALARHATADTVELSAIAPDGHETAIIILLGPGTVLMVEGSDSLLPEPDNTAAELSLRDRISTLEAIPRAYPVDLLSSNQLTDDYDGIFSEVL